MIVSGWVNKEGDGAVQPSGRSSRSLRDLEGDDSASLSFSVQPSGRSSKSFRELCDPFDGAAVFYYVCTKGPTRRTPGEKSLPLPDAGVMAALRLKPPRQALAVPKVLPIVPGDSVAEEIADFPIPDVLDPQLRLGIDSLSWAPHREFSNIGPPGESPLLR
jgi:hypothetical protein